MKLTPLFRGSEDGSGCGRGLGWAWGELVLLLVMAGQLVRMPSVSVAVIGRQKVGVDFSSNHEDQ